MRAPHVIIALAISLLLGINCRTTVKVGVKPVPELTIRVATEDAPGAGTDTNVSLILYGQASSQELLLDEPGYNDFERGHSDSFDYDGPPLGEITRLRVYCDDTGGDSRAWFLNSIKIDYPRQRPKETLFVIHQWLFARRGTRVCLEVLPGGVTQPCS